MRLTIAVCTWRRPEMLGRLLPILEDAVQSEPDVEGTILVVDNDVSESARGVCEERGVSYLVEPSRGVGHARNRALEATRHEDVVIFFDDDQVPQPGWLTAFLAAHRSAPEALWVGSVQPDVHGAPPKWARDWWPWTYPEYPDGTRLSQCNDGNLLVPSHVLTLPDCRYSDEFLSGMAQDIELTSRLHEQGVEVRYASAARALETLPSERTEPEWILRRARTSAFAMAKIWLARGNRMALLRSSIRRLSGATGYAVLGSVLGRSDLAMKSRRDRAILAGYREALTQ